MTTLLDLGKEIDKLGESIRQLMAERDRYKTALQFIAKRATYGTEVSCRAKEALEDPK
jgi:chorismate mutase